MEVEPNLSNDTDEASNANERLTEYTDEHFCIKCKRTLIGLQEYIYHRRARCEKRGIWVRII